MNKDNHRNGTTLVIALLVAIPTILTATQRLSELPPEFEAIRDPLIPIDYLKPIEDEVQAAPDPEELKRAALAAKIKWPNLAIRGITHAGGERFMAVIDRIGVVEAGEQIRILQDDLIYTWRVDKISAEGIMTTRLHVADANQPQIPLEIPPSTTAPGTQP